MQKSIFRKGFNALTGAEGVHMAMNEQLAVLGRRWKLVVICTLLALLAGAAFLLVTTPRFKAVGMLQINTRSEQVMDVESVLSGLNGGDAAIRTEIDVLQSRKLARRVVEDLKLANTPELASGGSLLHMAMAMGRTMLTPMAEAPAQPITDEAAMTSVVDNFLKRLNVRMLPRSYSIQVVYTSTDAQLSAKVANTLMQAYLTSQLEDRLDAARRATSWMNDRSKQMQQRVQAAERAVQDFREQHGLTTARGMTLTEQQLSELNSQLILARAQLAEAVAKSGNAGNVRGFETTADVLNSPLIQNLRMQETEVRRKMSDLAARYGERHPRIVTVRNELADVQRKISEESAKIRGSLHNEVDVAKARVKTFEDQLARLQLQSNVSGEAAVQLGELERQATAERTLYESFLNRSKEVAQMDFAQSDARIISAAETPVKAAFPKPILVMAVALVGGLLLGCGLAFGLEVLDAGFRTAAQVEKMSGHPLLGMLGELPRMTMSERARYVVDKPTSAFAEGVRAIRTAMNFAKPDSTLQVIMVTSSVPQEGKSLIAASLSHVHAMGKKKVLLVDADMRRPSQHTNFDVKVEAGLAEVLAGQADLRNVLVPVKGTGMTLLPSMSNAQFAQELLASERMKLLMAELRKNFDTIILDCPPVMAVADAQNLTRLADASLFVVRWGTTPRALAANGMQKLQGTGLGITGVVMSRVDFERQQGYGAGDYGYYYGKYKDYYTN